MGQGTGRGARGTKSSRRTASNKQHGAPSRARGAKTHGSNSRRPTQQAAVPDVSACEDLMDDPSTELSDQLERARALHARWIHEDAESVVVGEKLIARQQSRCRDIGLVVFGFVLHDAQVEAVRTLFYEQTNLLLLAKTGFGKSLIFQLLPFMTSSTGVGLILMPLKLL